MRNIDIRTIVIPNITNFSLHLQPNVYIWSCVYVNRNPAIQVFVPLPEKEEREEFKFWLSDDPIYGIDRWDYVGYFHTGFLYVEKKNETL